MYRYREAFSALPDSLRPFIHSLKGLVVMLDLEKPERLLLGEMMMIYAAARLREQTEAAVFALTAEVISGSKLEAGGGAFCDVAGHYGVDGHPRNQGKIRFSGFCRAITKKRSQL